MAKDKLKPRNEWTPPWGDDPEKCDPEKAADFIHSLLGQNENLQEKLDGKTAELKTANAATKTAEDALNEAKSGDSEELTQLKKQNAKLTAQLEDPDRVRNHPEFLKLEVAHAKGLDEFETKRLQGKDRDELEADADEWLARRPKDEEEGERYEPGGEPRLARPGSGTGGENGDVATEAELKAVRERSGGFTF